MITVKIKGAEFKATKNEAKEAKRIWDSLSYFSRELAQRSADIWMRSAPCDKSSERRKAIVEQLGLNPTIQYL